MTKFIQYSYILWLLSLPFYSFSVIGTLSLDNILAPLILFLSVVKYVSSSKARKKKNRIIRYSLFLYILFCSGFLLSVSSSADHLLEVLIVLGKYFIYLFIPVFYIQTRKELFHTIYALVFSTMIGSISVFIVSLGFLELSISRTSPGRLSAFGMPKSIGLFGNYGDLAILISMSIVATRLSAIHLRKLKHYLISLFVFITSIMGYLGAQSRNIIVTLLFSISVYLYFKYTIKRGVAASVFGILVVAIIGVPVLTAFLLTDFNPLEALSKWGGSQAKTTANDRLGQYGFAFGLLLESPIVGNGISVLKNGIQIHNIWLNVLSSGGIISAAALFGLFVFSLANTIKNINRRTDSTAIAINLSFLAALVMASEFYVGLTYIFFLVLGIVLIFPKAFTQTQSNS